MRGIALVLAVIVVLLAAAGARADEIEVRDVWVEAVDDGIALNADFDFELNPRLAETVKGGVPLYFAVEFELTRSRWWWFDERTLSARNEVRISYHPLSRQYRLASGVIQQSFGTLEEAVAVLRRVRNWIVVDKATSLNDAAYEAALRMRLDLTLLPRPFQVSALTSRDWRLESPWKRFIYKPGPAPTSSRQNQPGTPGR
ncbi:MAG: DUF4390 domain-containing protein [Burkholderiales bacterium]